MTAINSRSVKATDFAMCSDLSSAIEKLTVINWEILNLKDSNSRSAKAKDSPKMTAINLPMD